MDLNIIVHADKQRDGNDIIIKKIKAAAKRKLNAMGSLSC